MLIILSEKLAQTSLEIASGILEFNKLSLRIFGFEGCAVLNGLSTYISAFVSTSS
jgi:hypothetical protein